MSSDYEHKESPTDGCGFEGCYKQCLDCELHHPELCCMADEYEELVEDLCLLPKFICGYINRGGKHNDNNILSTRN